jgi:AcrR family transcriptional regulator
MSKRYHHGDLREALLDAAVRTLDAESLDAVTLRRLARETGVSHAAPYHHFSDLDALLAGVAARGFRMLREEMSRKAGPEDPDPFVQLRAAGTAYVTFAVLHPELFRLMFSGRWPGAGQPPELQDAAERAFAVLREMVRNATLPGADQGAEAVESGSRASWALVHGLAMLLVDGRLDARPGESPVDAAERITLEGTGVLGRGLRSL